MAVKLSQEKVSHVTQKLIRVDSFISVGKNEIGKICIAWKMMMMMTIGFRLRKVIFYLT